MQKTNLNVNPYYDDFSEDKNFHRVLFRPGYAVQARELTQLQTILQNQIERHGRHVFKEGTVIIPGSVGFTNDFYAVKLQSTFSANDITDYVSEYVGKRITGRTTGVVAEVIMAVQATTSDPITLFVKYIKTGSDNVTTKFANGENIYADKEVGGFGSDSPLLSATGDGSTATFTLSLAVTSLNAYVTIDGVETTSFTVNTVIINGVATPQITFNTAPASNSVIVVKHIVDSATLLTSDATATGSSANIQEGVFFIRGHFVKVPTTRIILDKYTNTPTYRVGLTVAEELETPEEDTSLLDNAQGSSNLNAKGAHRLKITATLSKLPIDSTADENFIELIRLKSGVLQQKARSTEYSVFEEAMAKRTYDQVGDFVVKPFDIEIRETLNDGFNNGVYEAGVTTESGNIASDDYLTIQVSPGKAYVNGYAVETITPKFIDVPKPRDTEDYNGGITPVEVGNYVIVNNVYNSPEITPFISGEIDQPYRQIDLYDTQTASRGTASGQRIGFARARAFEHFENNTGTGVDRLVSSTNTNTSFKLYLFDIRMFTKVIMSGTIDPALIVSGAKVTGSLSNAIGYVSSESSGTTFYLTTVVGNFIDGETLKISSSAETDELVEDVGNVDLIISNTQSFDFSSVKQTYMNSTVDFTADIVLQSELTLSGFVSYSGTGTTVNGFQTSFSTELSIGDIVAFPSGTSGALQERKITNVNSDTQITISSALSNAITSVEATRKRAKLTDQNKNLLLRKLQKRSIKTLKTTNNNGISDTSVTNRRSFIDTSNASGVVTFTLGSNETFNAVDNTDFVLTVLQQGSGGSALVGDIVNLDSANVTVVNAGNTLTITSATILGNGAKVRLISTVTRTIVSEKTKSRIRASLLLVDNDGVGGGAEYGTSAHHKDISLGVADGLKLHAVFDSEDNATDPVLPQWTLTSSSGVFTKGEIITGGTSGAKARVVNISTPITFIPLNDIAFSAGETVTGFESGETAVLDTYTAGSKNITSRFVFDSGQRDNYYDIARIIRKPNTSSPIGRLLVVFDYFTHGTGDFFTVDSYSTINYKDIPTYTATRVDPEVREPTGEYDLRDVVDFRPKTTNATLTTQTIQAQTVYKVTSHSFNFESRSFADPISIPKDNSNFAYDFEYYLGRIDSFTITPNGEFKVLLGTPSETPIPPKQPEGGFKLAENSLEPFVVDVKNVNSEKEVAKKYSAADIGRLEQRISNIEYYTSLSLLEKDAQSFEILDTDGFTRFKSGFLVDAFAGHSVGDVIHPDYRCSIDMENKELRPKYYMKGITLAEENTTDAERANNFYQKTGDIITLPYTHVVAAEQQFATRIENLNPVLNFSWAGTCVLSPSGDEWFEVDRLPDLIINREGNFNTVLAANRNAIGTVWNAWQTQWGGTSASVSSSRQVIRSLNVGRTQFIDTATVQRTVVSQTGTSSRSGINTQVVQQIDSQSQGDRILSQALIPFIRSRNVTFTAEGMKPLTRVYPFFDRTNVSNLVTPSGGSQGGALITSAVGKISGTFLIPNPNVNGNPRFRTGNRQFRLTSDSQNGETNVETFAQAIYSATGILNTVQETIIATRNARVVTTSVSQTTSVSRVVADTSTITDVQSTTRWLGDPLAQSFVCSTSGGEYITKVDIYFQNKDEDIPVLCEIREMENGYPTTKTVPFGSKILEPSQVSVSDDATVATTFTFDSPVYLKSGNEYCILLFSNSDKYLTWISRMGELDVGTNRLVSEQPFLGVLFKSQNASTWTAYDFEDLKFTLYRASFNTTATGIVNFVNDTLPVKELEEDPVRTFTGSNVVKIYHRDHHMYSTSNNVTISGVEGNDNTGTLFNGIPITEINKTHNVIGNIGIDSYTITTTATATQSSTGGGSSVTATENALADQIQTLFPVIKHPDTNLSLKFAGTSGTSVDGNQASFIKDVSSQAKTVTINDNYEFSSPKMICSDINETLELSGTKSLNLFFTLTTTKENLSPIIDTDRKTLVAVANRLNNVTSSSDVYPTEDFVSATEPDGDSLEAIYCTKKVQLKTPATAIKLLFDAVQLNSASIDAMYKILRSDDASDFDEIGWSYFNTDGSPDTVVNSSTTYNDFIEREYTANNLEEFIAFAIKLRMRGTNSAEPPRIKDLRAIALAL